jgi:hypothetical protein
MKRAMMIMSAQLNHNMASSPEISGQAIEYLKELTIVMR